MKSAWVGGLCSAALAALLSGCAAVSPGMALDDARNCTEMVLNGFRPLADERGERFNGKVSEDVARCRGSERAAQFRKTPYVDWSNYWATADGASLLPGTTGVGRHVSPNGRGIDGALLDLEYQRMELIKFNLFDNNGTYPDYTTGRDNVSGPALKTWPQMRLPQGAPAYAAVGGDGPQLCQGDLIRWRNPDGSCNDIRNPLMGSTGTPFARNVQFEATYPDLGASELTRNRHGNRLALLQPDPQLISRKLLTREQSSPSKCNEGQGLPGYSVAANCDYQKAPFFNVLAAFWIQFMTHDWFSHLEEGHNQPQQWMPTGCATRRTAAGDVPLTPAEIAAAGCRPEDRIDRAYVAQAGDPPSFSTGGTTRLARAYKTHANNVTAWWDASQIYGYDSTSKQRVKRDPADLARLLLLPGQRAGGGEQQGELPVFGPADPINPQWAGQSAVAFPDNWSIGMGFYHTIFAREHNAFVNAFRDQVRLTPEADSGLRNPSQPDAVIRYKDVSAEELYQMGRLVVSAEIAKIHTIEWTPQLLYDEPLYLGMNANWNGLLAGHERVAAMLEQVVTQNYGKSGEAKRATQWYSALASGPGIFGLGSHVYKDDSVFARYDPTKDDIWSLKNPDHVNGGANHFGSP